MAQTIPKTFRGLLWKECFFMGGLGGSGRRGKAGTARMLILTRKAGESLHIGDDVRITVIEMKGNQVRIGISAPSTMRIYREEIYQQIQEENRKAALSNQELPELPVPTTPTLGGLLTARAGGSAAAIRPPQKRVDGSSLKSKVQETTQRPESLEGSGHGPDATRDGEVEGGNGGL